SFSSPEPASCRTYTLSLHDALPIFMLGHQTGDEGAPDDGGPKFVLKMDHHATPALYGSNQAAFSVKLDAPGVTVIEKSLQGEILDRKSTRLNSSHVKISYAVFCLKK